MNEHNRRRALADMVSLDAWRGERRSAKADLHVDVVFGEARVGGEVEERARFRLSLKRAEVVVVIPATEPARIDKTSVVRGETNTTKVSISTTKKQAGKRGIDVKGGLGTNARGPRIDAGASAEFSANTSAEKITRTNVTGSNTSVVQSRTEDGDYRWIVSSIDMQPLLGHPWDADKAPRLKLVDTRPDLNRGIEPSVRVQVRCLREDLEITNIVLKDEKRWASLRQSPTHRNRVAAAEAVIRDRMMKAGLVHGALDEPYAQMCLAEVTVGEDE